MIEFPLLYTQQTRFVVARRAPAEEDFVGQQSVCSLPGQRRLRVDVQCGFPLFGLGQLRLRVCGCPMWISLFLD